MMIKTEEELWNRIADMQDKIDRLTAERDGLADELLTMAVRIESMDCLSSEDAETIERVARELKRTYLNIIVTSIMKSLNEKM